MAFNIYTHMQQIGQQREAIRNLEAKAKQAESDIRRLEASRNIGRGIWLAVVAVGSLAGTIGGIVSRVLFH